MSTPRVGILMGSASDFDAMRGTVTVLRELGVPHEVRVLSAHRSPVETHEYASTAVDRGLRVIVCGAGLAAALAGTVASATTLPVIGVPLASGPLNGQDALLSMVQMPPGIPVATVTIGPAGARNAGYLAVQMLALSDPALREKLVAHKRAMAEGVAAADAKIQGELG